MKKARPFQRQDICRMWYKYKGRALNGNDMGLGKTFESLSFFKTFLDKGPMVVVCPATVKYNWQSEATDLGLRAVVLEKRTPPSNVGFLLRNPSKTVYIINDEILGKGYTRDNTWNRFLKKLKPKLVVYDECHRLKSRTTHRTKNTRELCDRVPYVLMLSGTPLTSRPAELWPVLNILRPEKFPSFMRYANRYCKPEWTPWGMKYTGATRMDELHKLLKKYCMVRRRKVDVLDQLPPKTRTVVKVDIPPHEMKEYRLAERDFIKWLRKTNPKKASKARKSERLMRFGYLKRLIGKIKLKAVRAWINEYLEDTRDKLITFGVHKNVVGQLHTEYPNSVKVDGSITGKKRRQVFDRFKKDPKCRLFFGNIQAAGVGWNGQVANSVMFAELGWTPGEHTQAEDRAHRMGQNKPVNIYYLIAVGTIEETLLKMIQNKQNILDQTLDGKAGISDFDLLDQLEKDLVNKGKRK